MPEIISAILMLIGAFFMLVAAFGIYRMPDLFMRMSSGTKASTLGAGTMLLAAAVHFDDLGVSTRAIATIFFILLTAPVAAHMIGRAAYLDRVGLWDGTILNELGGKYNRTEVRLGSSRDVRDQTEEASETQAR